MSTEKSDQEPSMEEILSSIRRIIADDEDEAGPTKPAPEKSASEKSASDKPGPEKSASAKPGPTEAARPPEQAAESAVDENDDVLDLTQVVEPGDPKGRKAAAADSPPFDGETDEVDLEPEDDYPAAEPAPPGRPSAKPAAAASIAADDDTLVSAATAGRSTDAFARLTRTAIAREPRPLAGGDKTVEAFLVELLRPLLKEWLDANLDGVVERVVEQEVKKLARRAELR